jgi:hypothetical protein
VPLDPLSDIAMILFLRRVNEVDFLLHFRLLETMAITVEAVQTVHGVKAVIEFNLCTTELLRHPKKLKELIAESSFGL